MEVRAIIFCEGQVNLSSSDGGIKPGIINPTYSFRLKYIPSAFSFAVFLMAQGLPEKDTNIRIILQEPDSDKIIVDSTSAISAEIPSPMGFPREMAGLNISAQLTNVLFEKEGKYKCSVYIDGVLKQTSELYVDKEPVA